MRASLSRSSWSSSSGHSRGLFVVAGLDIYLKREQWDQARLQTGARQVGAVEHCPLDAGRRSESIFTSNERPGRLASRAFLPELATA